MRCWPAPATRADEIVGHLQPVEFRAAWQFTVEQVAVNAVMAGARPEYFPVILALAASELSARSSSSSSSAMMAVVNGPIRHEIGMNSGVGAMGPYNHANATIGRAYGLLSQNLQGGSVPGETYMGSQGNNYGYNNLTFAENEERSIYEPLHVQKGFKPADSAVSIFFGCRSTTFCLGLREHYWREHVRDMLAGIDGQSAPVSVARSAHGQAIPRSRRLRHQAKTHPLHPRNRGNAGGPLLGSATGAELRLSVGDVRPGADGDLAQGQA